jgi:LDH2 family malate/lactate/ureidoglycolate dehydrogenase
VVLDAGASVFASYRGAEFEDLLSRVPGAFFKSIGFMAVSVLLGGALTGFTMPAGDAIEARWPEAVNGGMVLAIDIVSVLPGEVFRGEVDRYARDLRETHRPIPGTDRVMLPGAPEEERLRLYRREGIHFGGEEQQAVRKAAERWKVPLPWD